MTAEAVEDGPRTLRGLVLDALAETRLSDPRDIAKHISEQLSASDRGMLFQSLLVGEVRRLLQVTRCIAGDSNSPAERSNNQDPSPTRPPGYSAKMTAIRSAWEKALTGAYSIGGEWKRLAEFTVADAQTAAEERRRQASELSAVAERFDALAKAIADAGAETAGELPSAPSGWS